MLPLAEVVQNLRSELYSAMASSAEEPLQFDLGDIELELTVAVSREGSGSGKVRFWVVDLGAEGKVGSGSTQRLTLKLTPRVVATGRAPHIAGATLFEEGTGRQAHDKVD